MNGKEKEEDNGGVVSFSRSQLSSASASSSRSKVFHLQQLHPLTQRFGSSHVAMQRQNQTLFQFKSFFSFKSNPHVKLKSRNPISIPSRKGQFRLSVSRSELVRPCSSSRIGVYGGNEGELSDEDDELCPVECVKEFKTDEEFVRIVEKAKESGALVVVDFYRTSCGSCKYIEQGFAKLCKGSGDQDAPVIFLKHNVVDEYDEQSEVAERLRIKTVPLFHFYKDGVLLEAFPTRDKERILTAISKYSSSALQV